MLNIRRHKLLIKNEMLYGSECAVAHGCKYGNLFSKII